MSRINQCSLLLNHLMRFGRISKKDADKLGISNLSARVWELRNLGLWIFYQDGYYKTRRYRHDVCRPPIDMEDDLFPDYDPNE